MRSSEAWWPTAPSCPGLSQFQQLYVPGWLVTLPVFLHLTLSDKPVSLATQSIQSSCSGSLRNWMFKLWCWPGLGIVGSHCSSQGVVLKKE